MSKVCLTCIEQISLVFNRFYLFLYSCGFNQSQEDCSSVSVQARRASSSNICQLNMFFLPGTTQVSNLDSAVSQYTKRKCWCLQLPVWGSKGLLPVSIRLVYYKTDNLSFRRQKLKSSLRLLWQQLLTLFKAELPESLKFQHIHGAGRKETLFSCSLY